MKKRLLSMLLALAMVLSMVPVFAGAETVKPQITKVSMTLNGILDVNFKVASNGADMTKASIKITDAVAQTIDTYTKEGDLYVYTAKVPAHKLNEDMNIELMYNGEAVQTTEKWNVWTDYLSKQTGDAEALANALHNYGTYAAAYAAGTATDAIEGITAAELAEYKPVIGKANAALGAVAALYLDDACDLLVKFNSSAWNDSYKLLIDEVDVTDKLTTENEKKLYRAEALLPQDWSHMYNIQVVDGETVVFQCRYGVNSYVYQALSRSTEAATGLNNLLKSMYSYGTAAEEYAPAEKTPVALGAIALRDPFILNDGDAYYLYGTKSNGSFNVWSSTDLNLWYDEGACYTPSASDAELFYTANTDGVEVAFWAPEVHKYDAGAGEKYYMFASFTPKADGNTAYQSIAILEAENPAGPFEMYSAFPLGTTCSTLDGTLYIAQNGKPYMIYCHEHQCSCCNGNGTMDYIQLSDDLKSTVGSSTELFKAKSTGINSNGTTDGCFVYEKNGTKHLLWATHIPDGDGTKYVQVSTTLTDNDGTLSVSTAHSVLYDEDGGHGMIFTNMNGVDKLVLHTPNAGTSRPALFNVVVSDTNLSLEGVRVWDGYGLSEARLNGTKEYTDATTLFIGDSFFDKDYWTTFNTDLAGKDARVFGIGGSTAEDWIGYIESGALLTGSGAAPKNIVVNLGNNDYYNDSLTAEQALENFKELFTLLHTNYPTSKLYVYAAVPRTLHSANEAKAAELSAGNALLQQWCADKDYITYIDLSGYEITLNSNDGIHPVVAEYQETYLATLGAAGCELAAYTDKTELLPVRDETSSVFFDKYDASYVISEGTAFTQETYTVAEMTATFNTADWPQMGFAVKQGENTVNFLFGTGGYNSQHIITTVNGESVSAPATDSAFSLMVDTTYEMRLIYDNGTVNIYYRSGDSWVMINKAAISVATMLGESYVEGTGVALGLYNARNAVDIFSNISITKDVPEIPQVLTALGNATYDKYTGTYSTDTKSGTGTISYAVTDEASTDFVLEATINPTNAQMFNGPMMKQGNNFIGFTFTGNKDFASDPNRFVVYINTFGNGQTGISVPFDSGVAFTQTLNTPYSFKVEYKNAGFTFYMKAEGASDWTKLNSTPYLVSTLNAALAANSNATIQAVQFDADAGFQAGVGARQGFGGKATDVTYVDNRVEIPQLLTVLKNTTYDKYTGTYFTGGDARDLTYAVTDEAYMAFTLTATVDPTHANLMNSAMMKQGDNVIGFTFTGNPDFVANGASPNRLVVYINTFGNGVTGISVPFDEGVTFTQSLDMQPYSFKVEYKNAGFTFYIQPNGASEWTKLNSTPYTVATLNAALAANSNTAVQAIQFSETAGFQAGVGARNGHGGNNTNVTFTNDDVEYSITYVLDGGTNAAGAPISYWESAAAGTELPTPTKEGYKFLGWYYGNTDTKVESLSTYAENLTLTAKWEALLEIPQVLTVLGNATYDKYTGTYSTDTQSGAGTVSYAVTDQASTDFVLEATVNPTNAQMFNGPMMKQGDNFIGFTFTGNKDFASDPNRFVVYINTFGNGQTGISVPFDSGVAFTQTLNTPYSFKVEYKNAGFTFYMKAEGASDWTKLNSTPYLVSTLNAALAANSNATIQAVQFDADAGFRAGVGARQGFGGKVSDVTYTSNAVSVIKHTITYTGLDGIGTNDSANLDAYDDGTEATFEPAASETHMFLGWYDADGNKVETLTVDSDITLEAKWAKYITSLSELNGQTGAFALNGNITNDATVAKFGGTFYGNGKTVSTGVSLFAALGDGVVIKDLTVDLTADITDGSLGILCSGDASSGNYANIKLTDITLKSSNGSKLAVKGNSGAFMHIVRDGTVFTNCVNYVEVAVTRGSGQGAGNVGGFVAVAQGAKFINCINYGDVTCTHSANGANVGGFAGTVGYTTFTDCTNYGNATSSGGVTGATYKAGGIIGNVGSNTTVSGCMSTGIVTGTAGGHNGDITVTFITALSELDGQSGIFALSSDITDNETTVSKFSGTLYGNDKTVYTKVTLFTDLAQGVQIQDLTIDITQDITATGILQGSTNQYADVKLTNITIKSSNNSKLTGGSNSGVFMHIITSRTVLTNCVNYVDMQITRSSTNDGVVGGFVANARNARFENCTNYGDIICTNDQGNMFVGGFAGDSQNCTFTGCVNEGTISSNVTAAGFIGRSTNDTVTGCTNKGTITGTVDGGGIIGYLHSGNITISDCTVTDGNISGGTGAGSLAARYSSGLTSVTITGNTFGTNTVTKAGTAYDADQCLYAASLPAAKIKGDQTNNLPA